MRLYTRKHGAASAFTLAELVISMAVLGLVIQGVIYGYAASAQRAEWNAHSLAAQSMASQGAEQARAAKWDPQQWPPGVGPGKSDETGQTNYTQVGTLDIFSTGTPMLATNFVAIRDISTNPGIREIRSECVWRFMNRGLFTNRIILLRAADQ